MIYQNIFKFELELERKAEEINKKREALSNIKKLLSRIDNRYETIPVVGVSSLTTLFKELKESSLTDDEKTILEILAK